MKKRCHRKTWPALPPRGLRPRLNAGQTRDLGMVHNINLDAIARGQGDVQLMWDWVASLLTWSRAAELLSDTAATAEWLGHLQAGEALVQRYNRTGRVAFTGPELQQARAAVRLMDETAERIDQATASRAAQWSEARLSALRGHTLAMA